MVTVPRQDWHAYAMRARASDVAWVRGQTLNDRFDLYADLFGIIWEAHRDRDNLPLEQWRWNRKIATRRRLVEAFTKLDELNRERAAAHHTD